MINKIPKLFDNANLVFILIIFYQSFPKIKKLNKKLYKYAYQNVEILTKYFINHKND